MSWSLSDAVCAEGIPSLTIGLAAMKSGLVRADTGEGTLHFEWDKEALDKRGIAFLQTLLHGLRQANGAQA